MRVHSKFREGTMNTKVCSTEIRMASPFTAMYAFLEPHRQWIESVLGCVTADSVTFECEVSFGQLVAEDILEGVALDRQCLLGGNALRPAVERWELPAGISPRIALIYSREQDRKSTRLNSSHVSI